MRHALLFVLLGAFSALTTADAQTIFLVRHAERADAGGIAQKDPALSESGRDRAQALADALRDAQVSVIYVTEFRRTQETAKPLAAKFGLEPRIIPAKESARLVAELEAARGNVLVIGHSNTLPEILRALGIDSPPKIGEDDYNNLWLCWLKPRPHFLRLHLR